MTSGNVCALWSSGSVRAPDSHGHAAAAELAATGAGGGIDAAHAASALIDLRATLATLVSGAQAPPDDAAALACRLGHLHPNQVVLAERLHAVIPALRNLYVLIRSASARTGTGARCPL